MRDHRYDAAFGVEPEYLDAEGRVYERIVDAGPTTLDDEAVRAWFAGTFTARSKLVKELTPRRPIPSNARTIGNLVGALDAAVDDLAADDAEVHCLLSGGIDSSAIVDALHRSGRRVVAHALLDEAVDAAELGHARALCERLGVTLHEHRIRDEELPGFFAEAVRAAERPLFNARGVSLALFLKRLGLPRVFSGIGADEALDSARQPTVETVFIPKTLPPTVWAPRAFGVDVLLPYLHGAVISASVGTDNKDHFRYSFVQRLGRELCFQPKSPRMARSVFEGPARAKWEELLGGPKESGYDAELLTRASFDLLREHFANAPWPASSS